MRISVKQRSPTSQTVAGIFSDALAILGQGCLVAAAGIVSSALALALAGIFLLIDACLIAPKAGSNDR